MAESNFKHYKPERFGSKYSRRKERRPYINQVNHELIKRKEKPFEYTFRKSRPKQQHEIIKDLNIQKNKIFMVHKIIECLKKSRKLKLQNTLNAVEQPRTRDKKAIEKTEATQRFGNNLIMERQDFTRVPLRRPTPPLVFFRPFSPTPTINPSIFIPTVFGK